MDLTTLDVIPPHFIVLDFETFYSREYSLRKMTTAQYILDQQFQSIMLSIKIDGGPAETVIGDAAIRARLAQIDWANTYMIAHHINFDGAIALWRYGVQPAMYGCTLSMARAVTHWYAGRSGLADVSKFLKLPPKGDEVV